MWDEDLGLVLVGPETQGRAHPRQGPRLRRQRHAAQGRAGRDLAGRCGRALQQPGGEARQGRSALRRLGPPADRRRSPANTASRRSSPAACPIKDGRLMAPHITFWIVARGINIGLHTRMYFGDEEAANAECPVLARIEHKVRVPTLIAARGEENGIADLHLRHPSAGRQGNRLLRHLTSDRKHHGQVSEPQGGCRRQPAATATPSRSKVSPISFPMRRRMRRSARAART